MQITLAALLAALHMDAGIATADGHPRIEPLIPNSLPRQIETVPAPPATAEVDTAPRCAWMSEFVL